jgi:hypothetical protein
LSGSCSAAKGGGTALAVVYPTAKRETKMDRMLQYADLLHRFQDPDARQVREFTQKYADSEEFTRRVQKMNALFLLKTAIEPAEEACSGGQVVA